MHETDWNKRGLELARLVATWSKDPSTKVGAALFDRHNRVLGVGYNGFPRGVADDERLHDRDVKYDRVIHAEMNLLFNSRHDESGGMRLYVTHPPCARCAAHVVQWGGISTVVTPNAAEMRGLSCSH